VVVQYEASVRERLASDMDRAGISWPPERVVLLAFKLEKRLEIWAGGKEGEYRFLMEYPSSWQPPES